MNNLYELEHKSLNVSILYIKNIDMFYPGQRAPPSKSFLGFKIGIWKPFLRRVVVRQVRDIVKSIKRGAINNELWKLNLFDNQSTIISFYQIKWNEQNDSVYLFKINQCELIRACLFKSQTDHIEIWTVYDL